MKSKGLKPQLKIEKPTNKLDSKYWKKFAKRYWEKRPVLVQGAKAPILDISPDQVFFMLVEYSNLCRKKKSVVGFKLFVDGQRQYDEDVLQILPSKKDRNFKGYHARMESIFSDYCLVCDELLQVSGEHWSSLTQFTDELFASVGLPNRFSELGLYLGNYRKTPFGVHVDGCGVFSFPLVGEKHFRLWTEEFVSHNPALREAHKYSKFLSGSEKMVATPGDMTYWPSSAWHIAESDGAFSATWSLGVWLDLTHKEVIGDLVKNAVMNGLAAQGRRATTPINSKTLQNGFIRELPEIFLRSLKDVLKISSSDYKDQMTMAWLNHLSKQGLKTAARSHQNEKVNLKSKVQSSRRGLILWARLKGRRQFRLAYQGQQITGIFSKKFLLLLAHLNQGKVIQPYHDLKGPNFKAELASLQQLANFGALISANKD